MSEQIAASFRLHPDIEALVAARQTLRAPGHTNAGCTVALQSGCTSAHLRDMAAHLTALAERMEERQP